MRPISSLQASSSKAQRPGHFARHAPQAMQPRTGRVPIQKVSAAIPSAARVVPISARAVAVLPSLWGFR